MHKEMVQFLDMLKKLYTPKHAHSDQQGLRWDGCLGASLGFTQNGCYTLQIFTVIYLVWHLLQLLRSFCTKSIGNIHIKIVFTIVCLNLTFQTKANEAPVSFIFRTRLKWAC